MQYARIALYSTVRDTEVVCWIVAAVAVMVTVDVTGVDPPPTLASLVPPPLQPDASPNPMKAIASNSLCCSLRRLQPKRQTVKASAIPLKEKRVPCRDADGELAEIVSTEVAATPEGIMLDGLNEQVAPTGSPEQEKLTEELKPFCGFIVSVTDPWPPETIVREPGRA
jgi:hypothetical protein